MKAIFLLFLFFIYSIPLSAEEIPLDESSHHQAMRKFVEAAEQSQDTIHIAVLIYNDIVLQDFAGPLEVFSKASKLTHGKYHIFTVGLDSNIVSTENGLLKVKPDYSIANMPDANYLIVPGASMPVINEMMRKNTVNAFISNWNKKKDVKTVSICTGAYLLANTGVLKNKKATTHFFVADDFSKQFPDIEVIKNVRFVDEGKYITSSGITSGIDVALHIVGKNSGTAIKDMISRALQYTFHEKEDWPVAPNGMKYRRTDEAGVKG